MKINLLKYLTIALGIMVSFPIVAQQRIKTEANSDIVQYSNKEGLPTTNISNIVQTRDGYIWLSGVEGTFRFNGYEFEEVGKEFGISEMQNIYYDSTKNILYFASPNKFVSFNGKEFKSYSSEQGYSINGLSGQVITFIDADSKGRIWIGSATPYIDKKFNGGLTKFENGKFTVYDSTNFPLDNATNYIETPYGDLIFKSDGRNTQTKQGSYIALYKNGAFKKIDESMGINLQGAMIFDKEDVSAIDKDGNTWLAFRGLTALNNDKTNCGILMYDGNKFYPFTDFLKYLGKDQLPHEVYYSSKLDKLFLTAANANGEPFSADKNLIFEYTNGKWHPSDILKSIKNIPDLKTEKTISDFRVSATFLTRKNKYFPELLTFQSNNKNNTDLSSKSPNQLFSNVNGQWKKYDAFSSFGGREINGGFLIVTMKGFGVYYQNNSKMLTQINGLLQIKGGIPDLYTDKNGNVWVTFSYTDIPAYAQTFKTGVNVWDGTKLTAITEKDGLLSDITSNPYQDNKMRVWIPTSKGITTVREIENSNGEQLLKYKNIQSDKHSIYNTSRVMETSSGDIYAWQNYVRPQSEGLEGANYYLGKFDGEKFKEIESPFNTNDNAKAYKLFDLREAIDGKLWFSGIFSDNLKDISSNVTKIMIWDGKKWEQPPTSWNVPSEQIHYVGKLKNGMYYLTSGKFYVFNGKKFINLSDSVDANADFRILKSASVAGTKTNIQAGNNLYIRLRNRGLVIFDGTHLKFFTKKNGLPSTNISNPVTDEKGNVSFGFPTGALVIRGEKFQTYFDDESIVSGGPYSAILDKNGNLVEFYNGVGLYINKGENSHYPLKISSVNIDKQSYFYQYPIDLNYSQNSFVFNYAALNYREPRQTTYEHFLEGFDKQWSRPSGLPFVEYQSLPPGQYRFRVRATTSNGVKTNEDIYSFRIHPPWWRTWLAYSMYIIGFVSMIGGIRKYELDRRKEKEKKKFLELENERKTKELEEARQLQFSMLPKSLPQLPHLDIAVYMKTATEVGGDYYDFHVNTDGTLTVILGDATGHGMMSGMMVSIMKSLFMSDRTNKELKPFFENASAAIKDMQLGRLMMALTCVQIKANNLVTTNAGMPPMFIYRKNWQTVEEIVINNMPLGAMKGVVYDVKELKIERGDTLLLMSDGFAELKNDNNEMFGYKRARNSFEEVAKKEPEEIVTYLKEEGKLWTNNREPDDDVTFVVIKIK